MGLTHGFFPPSPTSCALRCPQTFEPIDHELSRDQNIRLPGVGGRAQDNLGVTWQREGQQTLELFQATLGEDSFSHPVRPRARTSFQPQA